MLPHACSYHCIFVSYSKYKVGLYDYVFIHTNMSLNLQALSRVLTPAFSCVFVRVCVGVCVYACLSMRVHNRLCVRARVLMRASVCIFMCMSE
jgi:hypothetical protein